MVGKYVNYFMENLIAFIEGETRVSYEETLEQWENMHKNTRKLIEFSLWFMIALLFVGIVL